jgi:uncharacterized protein YegP (UPF0339 family)
VLASPYTVPLDYLRWPIQFESKGTSQTNDVIVAIDHWSLWGAGLKVHVFECEDGDWYWSAVVGNGEIVADSAEGYVDRSYCVKKAVERNHDAELVIDDAPVG